MWESGHASHKSKSSNQLRPWLRHKYTHEQHRSYSRGRQGTQPWTDVGWWSRHMHLMRIRVNYSYFNKVTTVVLLLYCAHSHRQLSTWVAVLDYTFIYAVQHAPSPVMRQVWLTAYSSLHLGTVFNSLPGITVVPTESVICEWILYMVQARKNVKHTSHSWTISHLYSRVMVLCSQIPRAQGKHRRGLLLHSKQDYDSSRHRAALV